MSIIEHFWKFDNLTKAVNFMDKRSVDKMTVEEMTIVKMFEDNMSAIK